MSTSAVPPLSLDARQLHARRCVRHPAREAAARCPGCGEFFCRECVVEHEGKLLCSSCLARKATAKQSRRVRLATLRRAATVTLGVGALWLAFYGVGALLVKIPSEVHDGTIWKKLGE